MKEFVTAQVVSVDMTVHPPSYAVDLGGNVRETEAPRLRPRGLREAAPPPAVPPGGNTFNGVQAPLAPPQKADASCALPAAVSVFATSGTVPVPVSVPVGASSAASWPSANCEFPNNICTSAGAAAEEDEDFGDFCDADVSAASTSSHAAAVALPNGSSHLQPDQQSAWDRGQPHLAGMQHGSGTIDASFENWPLSTPTTLSQAPAAAAAASGSRAQVPLSFASFDAFHPAAHGPSSTQPSTGACGAAVSGMDPLPGAATSSFVDTASWPAAVPAHSSFLQHGPAAVVNVGTEEFGDFEAADWQAHSASSAACLAFGPLDSHSTIKVGIQAGLAYMLL